MALQTMRAGKSYCVLVACYGLRVGFESCFGLLELSAKLSSRGRAEPSLCIKYPTLRLEISKG